ncbi:UDP-N-acetylmuramate dehydrogenase [Desulfopila sp. IMCC35008]|uniref:UDP-N-acetylmuramate dehydrogenase n=1 Tax=Desulfopila sp. IMCC35008 TaxID=2653858 RepID=UPI0013D2B0E9|nr:UDP-N-acetylmuramate dehydrogenase [Desulfopila sp. IMCC35008]
MPRKIKELQQNIERLLAAVEVRFDEPMSGFTSFQVGGPADILLIPRSVGELSDCLTVCRQEGLDVFLLGGGTNLLVSDRGIRGVVLLLTGLAEVRVKGLQIIASAGASVEKVCEVAADHGLSGMEFLYGLPGTIGGALWMNARCYGGEMSELCVSAQLLTPNGESRRIATGQSDFSYKKSPFQLMDGCITDVVLQLHKGEQQAIRAEMQQNYDDRVQKGHFQAPSAGSLFKNNRDFGAPTGKILDELGLRGRVSGGAAIAPFHGNIFINNGSAKAVDILDLIVLSVETARSKLNILLEPEVRFVGEWSDEELAPLAEVLS